ncbi:hypothetical protein BD289DRAFT_424896, partial [Coniella lustricola]
MASQKWFLDADIRARARDELRSRSNFDSSQPAYTSNMVNWKHLRGILSRINIFGGGGGWT